MIRLFRFSLKIQMQSISEAFSFVECDKFLFPMPRNITNELEMMFDLVDACMGWMNAFYKLCTQLHYY